MKPAYLAARVVMASLAFTPLPVAGRLARCYAAVLDRTLPRLRRTAYRNLQFALPQADHAAIVDGVFRSIGRIFLSLARFPQLNRSNISDWIRFEGFEHVEEGFRRGRGILFATAHLGNWELSAFAFALLARPMYVVVRPLDNPLIDRLIAACRTRSGNTIIGKKDDARAILKALRANEAVGILVDQNAAPEEGTFVDFFGVPASAHIGFARLAHRSRAAVVPGFALWSEAERKFILRFYPILEVTGDAVADTARLHACIESVIREYPDQWLWVHRRWKTRPPGEPELYR